MKKLITLLIIVLSLTSYCEDIDKTVENPSTFNTVKLQELPKDTIVISIDGSNLYVFDANTVISHTVGIEDTSTPINNYYIIIMLMFILLLLLLLFSFVIFSDLIINK
jgi:hypothetical protein